LGLYTANPDSEIESQLENEAGHVDTSENDLAKY
jgi:hypothetical protein